MNKFTANYQLRLANYKYVSSYLNYLIILLAATLRLWALDIKPPHFDEGINGWFANRITETGFYAYNPTNYHGPLYFYLLFITQILLGKNLWALRLPAVMSSIATVWLAFRFDFVFGKKAARLGALALAVSPAMVFYGRYSIHESSVVASLMIFTLGLFGLWRYGDRRSLQITFLGATLLLLLKETALIHLGCFVLAAGVLMILENRRPSSPKLVIYFARLRIEVFMLKFLTLARRQSATLCKHNVSDDNEARVKKGTYKPRLLSAHSIAPQAWHACDLTKSLLLSLGFLFFFYSGTLLNCRGLLTVFQTLPAWIHTGTASGAHEKLEYQLGWFNFYWLALMIRYEWPSLLGCLYALRVLWKGPSAPRYLAIYSIGVLVAYSIIPYKTPWCIISIIWPFTLLFGLACEEAWSFLKWQKIVSAIISLLLLGSLALCLRLNFWRYATFSEPYVYVQTSPEINRVTDPLLFIAHQDPQNFHLHGQILLESYYPLPWMLSDFTSIGYFTKEAPPKKLNGDFIAVEASQSVQIEKQLCEPYYREEFQLRDAMEKCAVYFKAATFHDFFEKEKKNSTGKSEVKLIVPKQ